MIFCFDIDGTLTEKPKVFKEIMAGLKKQGHTVYPLTGMVFPDTHLTEEIIHKMRVEQLKLLGLEYGVDYDDVVICLGSSPQHCGELKGHFCKQYDVVFMVEDTSIYAESIKALSPDTLCLRMPNGL